MHVYAREVTGHRASVPSEDPSLSVQQLEAPAPSPLPAVGVDEHLREPHLLEGRRVEDAVAPAGEKRRPRAQVADRRPQLAHRGHTA